MNLKSSITLGNFQVPQRQSWRIVKHRKDDFKQFSDFRDPVPKITFRIRQR